MAATEAAIPANELTGDQALKLYMQRFSASKAEAVVSNFDPSTFEWNVEELIDNKTPVPKKGESFSFLGGDGPIRPQRQLHYNIPSSVRQLTAADSLRGLDNNPALPPRLSAAAARTKASPLVNSTRGEAIPNKGRGQVPIAAKFQSIPLPGAISAKAFATAPSKGAAKGNPKSFGKQLTPAAKSEVRPKGCDVNLDGREILCAHCRLPMGDFGYPAPGDKKGAMIHGECMAQQVLQELENDEDRRRREDEGSKALRRREYGIGWKVEQIPRNFDLQQRLRDAIVSHGMCCLVLQEGSKSVRLAPTIEPSAAINLEYLSLALQVRRRDGREPLFSLDPVQCDAENKDKSSKESSQVKRFEPEWLAGTSVGEVLFQADYHLKELSMGECDQPVVGMKSILDLCKEEDYQKWSAREWFMVRHAEVQISEDHVLVPQVKMGVEAREQMHIGGVLEDAPITRKEHPMVKYAESFSKNFDLIAERKSVVYHLRELAKASVLAKFLIEADVAVEESWFNLSGEVEEACALEIPQLWNERAHSKIRVRDGQVVGVDQGIHSNVHGIYGGVSFGLDKFDITRIAPRRAVPVSKTAEGLPGAPISGATAFTPGAGVRPLAGLISPMTSVTPVQAPPVHAVPLSASLSGLSTRARGMGMAPPVQAVPLSVSLSGLAMPSLQVALSAQTFEGPQGVDLNLNQFSLDMPTDSAGTGSCISEPQSKDAYADMTNTFWSCIDQEECSQDWKLLKAIYNPNLSDRRTETDSFTPPDTSTPYTNKLRNLVKQEDEARQQRKEHFFSTKFADGNPGEHFPSSWTSHLAIARTKAAKPGGTLQPRKDYAVKTEQVMKSGPPAFQRTTEDGMAWRIYRVGSLEVRTTQEYGEKEVVGAVFSVRQKTHAKTGRTALGHERITKVAEYVEKMPNSCEESQKLECRYYVVLQTEYGSTIVTERSRDVASWEENVADLEDRNSLAKVVRTAACRQGVTVEDLKSSCAEMPEENRSYATGMFVAAVGGMREAIEAIERHRKDMETKDAHAVEEEVTMDDEGDEPAP